ncbi:retrovirus-related pol polyprotein from transposon TNT 1-94 [Tanacetum coccineum]|uniref:Retrovirus-related pol polyprotein from transposon TNT 1-94 n=1 Tax=Tanacetum coccineum TaxID=301880 RepID=A0ABQ4XI84_9ASTR
MCFVRDLQRNDLLTGNRGSDLYTISLQETTSSTLICLMAKVSPTQAWLWHRRLSHLNFDYTSLLSKKDVVIGLPKLKYVNDQLCSSCEVSKAKRSSFKTKVVSSSKGRLNLLHMDLCGPMRVASINGKKYILTLHAFFKEEGIEHQTSTPRTPEQNGVVERRNRTLVEAARTMLLASKLSLFFWVEAIATVCYTQNRSIIIPTHEKTAYHIINDRKPSIKHLHIFGCTCYLTRDGENLDKMKEKGDSCRFWWDNYISVKGLVPQRQKASDYDNPDPAPELQNVSPSADTTVPSQQELDLLFGPLYDEFFNDDTQPSTNIHPTSEPSTPTNAHAEENNVDQAIIPIFLYTDHPLSQVRGNPSKPVQTRRQLATYPEMCMFALTVSTAEPKNIKEGTWTENGISKWSLKEEVMLPQPDGVVDPVHLTKFTVKKDLYGLKQAPGACMMTLKILDFQGFNKVLGLQIHLNPHEVFLSIWPITFSDSEKTCPGAFSLSAGCLRCMTVLLYHPQWLNYVALSGSCAQVAVCSGLPITKTLSTIDSQSVNKSPTHLSLVDSARTFQSDTLCIHNDECKSFHVSSSNKLCGSTSVLEDLRFELEPLSRSSMNNLNQGFIKMEYGDAAFR